jgi:cysteine desulfurase
MGIDLMTFSGHKIYGPKGVGALFVRSRAEHTCAIEPMLYGGGQERGLRSGTLNVPGIVGLATAGEIAHAVMTEEHDRIKTMRDRFEAGIEGLQGVVINGHRRLRSATTSNVTFGGIDGDIMLNAMTDVCASKGSACSSAKPKPSHVLTAMGRSADDAACTLRFSFGRFTTDAEIDQLCAAVCAAHHNAEKVSV